MSTASPARVAAVRALVAVDDGAHLEDALADLAPPPGPDRDLAWFLAFGAVRRRGEVDAALRAHLSRPIGGLDDAVRAVLRVGAFEALFARTQAHATVHQAVEVAREVGAARASGLVNAVLRKVGPGAPIQPAEALNHPAWLVERWVARYGREATKAWCQANAEPPPLFVVRRDMADASPPLEGAVPATVAGEPIPGCWRLDPSPSVPIPELPGFEAGDWWVQDAAAVLMADLVPVEPGMVVLDACAAPGGKSFRLASRGARVVAADRDVNRLERMVPSIERVKLPVRLRQHDWSQGPWPPRADGRQFDAVLVDAPCSALGTVRRHPEVRWRRQPQDLVQSGMVQGQILSAAAGSVAVGGVLVYAVCSPEPEEGPEVVARFLAGHPSFEQEGERGTAPPEAGEDAHYGVRLRRRPG